ncbi:predicted protein [Histoplasma mississippiense (nom. inval.)]|uniref:predicted protein n=1 Tax=Ajellomyces capsulatus (strain NAm1 / WU24) TaxID=2059318 RepID=UPI000157B7D1|nr:predicted protein [Histoplasma mississippiense (nom. inval.)]EDN03473.1 predicted protein [Histoplasma mississippiense (nom. inval.)]
MSNKTGNIRACIQAVEKCLGDRSVLIGGAAMQLLGSNRTTNDIDILVSTRENISSLDGPGWANYYRPREYFGCFAEPGTDPLSVILEE